jgi:glutathione synthase/RimK-type ligase-like ATP-grasp enzyme
MIPIIWPYKMGSQSAKALAACLETKRVRSDGNYRPKADHLIINWGNTQPPALTWAARIAPGNWNMLNKTIAVNRAANKLETLGNLGVNGVNIPEFALSKDFAALYFREGASKIYCRTKLNGHSGAGIVIATTPEELVDAPLYTVGLGWRQEFRVHVFNGEVIDYAKKCKMAPETLAERSITLNSDIRSHSNGWVFCREGIDLPNEMSELAIQAVAALDLDFGAVDCARTKDGTNYVLEVNTAPGLEGQTITAYVDAIRRML